MKFKYFKTTSYFPRLETWQDLETFPKYVSLSTGVDFDDVIFNFDDLIKNRFLVCKLHTSHLTQSMTFPIVIIPQGVSFLQI